MFERLSDMAIFAKVAEQGSFTHAATIMGMTKGTVSKAVNRLEQHFGAKLLKRTTRKLALTNEGEAFLKHCQIIVSEAHLAEEHIAGFNSEPTGTVSVSAPVNFGAYQVAPVLGDIMARFPKLNIQLQLSDAVVAFKEQAVDIAIRCGELQDSALYYRKLKPLTHVAIASISYLNKYGIPATPDELDATRKQHWCIPRESSPIGSHWRFLKKNSEIIINVAGRFFSNENRAIKEAVMNDLGIAILPKYSVIDLLSSGQAQEILKEFMPPPTPVSLLYQEKRYVSSAVSEVINYLEAKLNK